MSRLIDADALLQTVSIKSVFGNDVNAMKCGELRKILELIENAPTVEPQRMRGRWKPTEPDEPCFYQCSLCRCLNDEKDNFCKNCGAKMGGTE